MFRKLHLNFKTCDKYEDRTLKKLPVLKSPAEFLSVLLDNLKFMNMLYFNNF